MYSLNVVDNAKNVELFVVISLRYFEQLKNKKQIL